MNVFINTPFLTSSGVKNNFDNKILVFFVGLIIVLVFLGLFFIDLTKDFSKSAPV